MGLLLLRGCKLKGLGGSRGGVTAGTRLPTRGLATLVLEEEVNAAGVAGGEAGEEGEESNEHDWTVIMGIACGRATIAEGGSIFENLG